MKLGTYRDAETGVVHILEILGASGGNEIYVLHCAPAVGRTVKQRRSKTIHAQAREDVVVTCFWCLCDMER